MPTLDFKGKQHIYAHHLTVPYRPLVPDPLKSLSSNGETDVLQYEVGRSVGRSLIQRQPTMTTLSYTAITCTR